MTASFAAYASNFINRPNQAGSSLASSQPMFYSFTTDASDEAGHHSRRNLDDSEDPHLRGGSTSGSHLRDIDDEDPYLHPDEEDSDEDEMPPGASRSSHMLDPYRRSLLSSKRLSERAESPPGGWLAHQAHPMRFSRSPSPARSDSTDSEPPPDLFGPLPTRYARPTSPPKRNTRQAVSLSMTESLLPRDGRARPLDVFSLPDPIHVPRRRRKYHDSIWTSTWLGAVTVCVFFCILLLFTTRRETKPKGATLPYTTLLHTVPLITILTFVSAALAYTHVFLLRIFVGPVMIATSVFIPATLFISAVWAFVGSFMWDRDTEPTWGESTGLRLFSLIPLILCIITSRRLLKLPQQIHTTSATLTLTTNLLIQNPLLLALSPCILLISLLASLPFVTLIFRLLLIGYFVHPLDNPTAWEWHVRGWANWAITGTVVVWLWTWGVARGTLRMTAASVIGYWYFKDQNVPIPPPMDTHTIHSALVRSTGPSLGSTCLGALILTMIRVLTGLTIFLDRLPLYLPAAVLRYVVITNGLRVAVGYLEAITTSLSKYALVYVGLTGDPFMPSARRTQALTSNAVHPAAGLNSRRSGLSRSAAASSGIEPALGLLTVAPLTLTFPFALSTYLFVAHTLGAPDSALRAAVLAGGVTALVGLFCVGLVKDVGDTLWICYCIDLDEGARRREEVFAAFEYSPRARDPEEGQIALPDTPAISRGLGGSAAQEPYRNHQQQYQHEQQHAEAQYQQQRQYQPSQTSPSHTKPSFLQVAQAHLAETSPSVPQAQYQHTEVPIPEELEQSSLALALQDDIDIDPFGMEQEPGQEEGEGSLDSPESIEVHPPAALVSAGVPSGGASAAGVGASAAGHGSSVMNDEDIDSVNGDGDGSAYLPGSGLF